MSIEKANEIVKKLASGELGCTIEEFKTAIKDNNELSEKELSTVAGGKAKGPGGCQNTNAIYYNRDCVATVEEGSWCHSHDWCSFFNEPYKRTDEGFGCKWLFW